MSAAGWLQFGVFIALVGLTAPPLGRYMARVYGNERTPGERMFSAVERPIYRLCGVDPNTEQRWTVYGYSLLAFSLMSFLVVYGMQRFQSSLPFNPTDVGAVGEHLSFNTAVSFMTNTNWQSYGGAERSAYGLSAFSTPASVFLTSSNDWGLTLTRGQPFRLVA